MIIDLGRHRLGRWNPLAQQPQVSPEVDHGLNQDLAIMRWKVASDRYSRYDRALAEANCDVYLSASSADIHHLTGSEDGNAFLIYRPGYQPTIAVRASGFNCTVASAKASDVIALSLVDDPVKVIGNILRRMKPRRVALGPINPRLAEELRRESTGGELISTPRLGRDVRRIKEPEEISLLEQAAHCVGSAIEACFETVKCGCSDREAAGAACSAARRAGADSILFVQVKGGPRSSYPDAEEVGRIFGNDEIGIVDMGVLHHFYRGDYARAFVIGEPPDEVRRIVEVVDRIQREALTILRPGLRCRNFYQIIRQMFAEEGYPDALPHHLGHGVGVSDDTVPMIVPTSEDEFVAGEVVCVEPAVYVAGVGGARIEDTVVIQAAGNRVLSHAPRSGYC